ncbi:sigma-54-dependent transcriptional regulator [Thiolapillus sp.]|uniref:sigma-54-dependent transcriptional regulator n=5 Tax=Thiolapillus sp. TaxID=2017437 RepID=UPI0025FB360F|nr:sigma-54 dependent transcriptional regulator [Thiolapillus sp.]
MANILVVEDDEVFSRLLTMHLEDLGHTPLVALDLAQARTHLSEIMPDAVLLDQQLPDGYGMDLLREIKEEKDAPPVIMVTGVSDNALVIEAMKAGAYDFVRKPMDELELDTTLNNALHSHRLSRKVHAISKATDYEVDINQIVGKSPSITRLLKTIGSVAASRASVLITGESGTGKEVVARAIHHHSERSGLFLPVNCSAIVENLLESELFGHEKGSFTGADRRKPGKFELASDGTLFLDELGELPLNLQAKLLRVLQEGTYERVGGTETLHTSARIITATNRDLETMVKEGRFREDLYYRLNVVNISLPPLRERMEDLPLLTKHLLRKINQRLHTQMQNISEAAWSRMQAYEWPGNVRELENILTRATVLCRDDTITPDLLGIDDASATDTEAATAGNSELELISLDVLEERHVRQILEYTRWHKGKACTIPSVSSAS